MTVADSMREGCGVQQILTIGQKFELKEFRHKKRAAGVYPLKAEILESSRRSPMSRTVWNRFFIGMALITSIALLIWIAGAKAFAQNTTSGVWTANLSKDN